MEKKQANRIRELRKTRNMTQLRLSIELEISQEAVSSYENGKYYPSCESLLKMSRLFNTSVDYILGLSDTMVINSEIRPEEDRFLSLLRNLDDSNKNKVFAYMQGLADQ